MSERGGSGMERLWNIISRSTQNRFKMASFEFRDVLCRIRLFQSVRVRIYRSRRGRSWPIETRIDTLTGPEQDSESAADFIFGTRFDFNVASSKCSASCGITANDCAWIYHSHIFLRRVRLYLKISLFLLGQSPTKKWQKIIPDVIWFFSFW